jgi:hypothetical protein
VHETKSKFFIPFLILIKVHKHKQTGIPLSFWFLSFILACLSAKQTQILTGTFAPFFLITACLHSSKCKRKLAGISHSFFIQACP